MMSKISFLKKFSDDRIVGIHCRLRTRVLIWSSVSGDLMMKPITFYYRENYLLCVG